MILGFVILIFLRGNANFVIFRLCDGADDAAGDAIRHVTPGDVHAAFDDCACADEAVFLNDGAFLNNCAHADEDVIVDGTAVDDGVMPDGNACADMDIVAGFHMEGDVFL